MKEEFGEKLTTHYRDIFKMERNKFLNEYAKENDDDGDMYYIYGKNSKAPDKFNATNCKDGESNRVIEIKTENLPNDAEEYSVLRLEDGNYTIDEEATEEVTEEMSELLQKIIDDQKKEIRKKRIENHIYLINEKAEDRIWIYDITDSNNNESEEIEEIYISKEFLEKVKEGDKIVYKNGEYILINEGE